MKRKNRPGRVRGNPLFDLPQITPPKNKSDIVKPPESDMDIARFLSDEVKIKWPSAETPASVSGKHSKLNKTILEEFSPETIREMVRVLVWDFEEIKSNKAFFPSSNHLNWPWLDQLYNYRHALASSVKTGITNSNSRVSAYAQRYHSPNPTSNVNAPVAPAQPINKEESLKDAARRLLGQ